MTAAAKLPSLISAALAHARPKFNIFMKYAKVELAPPKLSEIPQIKAGLGKLVSSAKSGAWKQQTVKQATLNMLVGAEVLFWFYVGECIGKRHILLCQGKAWYQVPPQHAMPPEFGGKEYLNTVPSAYPAVWDTV